LPYLLDNTFNNTANTPPEPPQQRRLIDKNAPIASLAAGNNQFTAIADTDHAKGNIMDRISAEMPQLAKAGVKHLMLEYTIAPIGDPLRSSDDEKTENILYRLNSRPPKISEQEIMANAKLFKSLHETGSGNETGKAYADLLISAMKAGITVHFAGDYKGEQETWELGEIQKEGDKFLRKYAKLERFSQQLDKDPDFIKNLNWPEREKRALEARIYSHRDTVGKIYDRWIDANERFKEERLGTFTEIERAHRFVGLANGEKSVVVFGSGHFDNKFDLNEAINVAAKMDALKHGRPIPARTPVVEIYADQKGREGIINFYAHEKDGQAIIDPALRIFADSGKVEIPESSQKDFAFKPIAQTPPTASYAPASAR
jgi:hypothetical protein